MAPALASAQAPVVPDPAAAPPTPEEAATERARGEAYIARLLRLNAGQALVRSERQDMRLERRSIALEGETSSRFYEGMGGISVLGSYISSTGWSGLMGLRLYGAVQLNGGYTPSKGVAYGMDILCVSVRGIEATAGVYSIGGTGASPFRISVPLYASFLPVKLPRVRLHFIVDSPILIDALLRAVEKGDSIRTKVLGYGFGVEWAIL